MFFSDVTELLNSDGAQYFTAHNTILNLKGEQFPQWYNVPHSPLVSLDFLAYHTPEKHGRNRTLYTLQLSLPNLESSAGLRIASSSTVSEFYGRSTFNVDVRRMFKNYISRIWIESRNSRTLYLCAASPTIIDRSPMYSITNQGCRRLDISIDPKQIPHTAGVGNHRCFFDPMSGRLGFFILTGGLRGTIGEILVFDLLK